MFFSSQMKFYYTIVIEYDHNYFCSDSFIFFLRKKLLIENNLQVKVLVKVPRRTNYGRRRRRRRRDILCFLTSQRTQHLRHPKKTCVIVFMYGARQGLNHFLFWRTCLLPVEKESKIGFRFDQKRVTHAKVDYGIPSFRIKMYTCFTYLNISKLTYYCSPHPNIFN